MPEAALIQSSRPTVVVDGREEPSLSEGLTHLLVEETTSGLYRCEATFGNWGLRGSTLDYLYFDRRTLDFGKPFQVKHAGGLIFDGRITALEASFEDHGPRNLNVLAEDRFQDLRMTRRTRAFGDVTDRDIFSRIANDHGLKADVNVSGPKYRVLSQVNQSDLAFLRERARAVDAELWMDGSTLNAKAHANRGGGTLQLTYGAGLREFSVIADLAHQRTSVKVSGWDVSSKEGVGYEATDTAIRGELNGDTSGAQILASAFGERREALAHTVPFTAQEARAQAESYFRMNARRFVVGRGKADADARLRVGSYVELKNLGPLFSGRYYLAEVRHLFDYVHGIRTQFTAERPGLGKP